MRQVEGLGVVAIGQGHHGGAGEALVVCLRERGGQAVEMQHGGAAADAGAHGLANQVPQGADGLGLGVGLEMVGGQAGASVKAGMSSRPGLPQPIRLGKCSERARLVHWRRVQARATGQMAMREAACTASI